MLSLDSSLSDKISFNTLFTLTDDNWCSDNYKSIIQQGISLAKTHGYLLPIGGHGRFPCSSEAFGLTLRNAVFNHDFQHFSEIRRSYLYISSNKEHKYLQPSLVDYRNINHQTLDKTTSSNADQDMIQAFIEALDTFDQLKKDQNYIDLTYRAIISFIDYDIHQQAITEDCQKGHLLLAQGDNSDLLKTIDSFDPNAFDKMIDFLKTYFPREPKLEILQEAKTETFQLIYRLAKQNNWWIGDQIRYDLNNLPLRKQNWGEDTFGHTSHSFMFLLHFSEYLANEENQSHPEYNCAKKLLLNVIKNLICSSNLQVDPSRLNLSSCNSNGARVLASIFLSLCTLKKLGFAYEEMGLKDDSEFHLIHQAFNSHIKHLQLTKATKPDSYTFDYSCANYFDLQISLLCEGVLHKYDLKPTEKYTLGKGYLPEKKCTPSFFDLYWPSYYLKV